MNMDELRKMGSGTQQQPNQQSLPPSHWYQDKFMQKVIIFICVLMAISTMLGVAIFIHEKSTTDRMVDVMEKQVKSMDNFLK